MIKKAPLAAALALIVGLVVMTQIQTSDAEVRAERLETYCEGVAIWKAEGARGIPKERRAGQPDYRDIAEDSCPGLRPAAPATDQPRQLARY